MGLWFFLTVVVAGNMALRAYKLRISLREHISPDRALKLERELHDLREQLISREKRLEQLEETVFFGDFELKQKFSKLESEFSKAPKATVNY